MLTKKELERRRERSGRTVLALLCVSCQMKNFFGQLVHFCGAWEPPILFTWRFSVDLDRDLPSEEIAGVEWCSDAFVNQLAELKILFFLYTGQDCVEKIVFAPKKTQPRWEPRRSTSLLSPFLYLPLVL